MIADTSGNGVLPRYERSGLAQIFLPRSPLSVCAWLGLFGLCRQATAGSRQQAAGRVHLFACRPARHDDWRMLPGPSEQSYIHGYHDSVLRSHRRRTAQNSAAHLLAHLDPTSRLLDVGCGPGTITVDLAARCPAGEVVGVDAAAEVLEEAVAEARSRECDNVTFEVGDVYHLRFADGAFDVVHAHQVLQHLSDPVAALVEMRRVCRPGGLVAVRDADYGAMFWFPDVPGMEEWRTLYRRVARAAGGEPDAGRRLLSWARAAGFAEVAASASAWCFATLEERNWWAGLWAERLTSSRLAEQAIGLEIADTNALEGLADAWRAWGAYDDACFVVPHGELICTN